MTSKQAFKRILKDMGIYNIYLKDRKKVGKNGFDNLLTDVSFGNIISQSFYWADTDHHLMWYNLYSAHPSVLTCEEMVNDCLNYDNFINCLNRIVKRYI